MADLLYLMGFLDPTPPPLGPMAPMDVKTDLHLTVLPAFAVPDKHVMPLRRAFRLISYWFHPVPLLPVHMVNFGPAAMPIPAMTLDDNANDPHNLRYLHRSLLGQVKHFNGFFHDPYVGSQYVPHISYWTGPTCENLNHMSLVWHRRGFGKDVVNLSNYFLEA